MTDAADKRISLADAAALVRDGDRSQASDSRKVSSAS